jgi:hypothetical protein
MHATAMYASIGQKESHEQPNNKGTTKQHFPNDLQFLPKLGNITV